MPIPLLDRLLNPDGKSLPIAMAQGCVVLVIGVGIVAVHFVRRGFRWPNQGQKK